MNLTKFNIKYIIKRILSSSYFKNKHMSLKKEFSYNYIFELGKIQKFLKANEGKNVTISFTKKMIDGKMQEPRNFYGKITGISKDSFEFHTCWDIENSILHEDTVLNIVKININSSFLPTLGITPIKKIFD